MLFKINYEARPEQRGKILALIGEYEGKIKIDKEAKCLISVRIEKSQEEFRQAMSDIGITLAEEKPFDLE